MKRYVIMLMIAILYGCQSETEVTPTTSGEDSIQLRVPENFPAIQYNLDGNPFTEEKFNLGKKIFFDTRLSRNNTISCGSCHIQSGAFSHVAHDVSHGINDLLGTRNAPTIFNLAWQNSFFWDGGVGQLDLFHLNPIQNPVEMDEDIYNIIDKFNQDTEYKTLFKNAFGSETIVANNIFKALSIFCIGIVSNQSPYDEYLAGNTNALTAYQKEGMELFTQKCSSCHSGILFTDHQFRNNGLVRKQDFGRYRISLLPTDSFKFKTPTLRNVGVSSPYMHDGRFTTLNQVLDHYSNGVQYSTTLDASLQQNGNLGIPLTYYEKQKIIAFLNTLTDSKLLSSPLFSE